MELVSRFAKDVAKAKACDWFIGIGSAGSSTDSYMEQYGERANELYYPMYDSDTKAKRVFVSLNGKRPNRVPFSEIKDYVDAAIGHGMTLVCDNTYHANRAYNVGEREFAAYMKQFIDSGSYTYRDHVSYGVYTATF